MLRILVLLKIAVFVPLLAFAQITQPPIEAYGNLPEISGMAISPNGEKISYIARKDGLNRLVVFSLTGDDTVVLDIGDLKAGSISWAGDKHVILRAFKATRINGYGGRFNYTAAFAVNVKTKKVKQLLASNEDLYPAQSGIGRIIGLHKKSNDVLMPAYTGSTAEYSVMKVDLDSGRGRIFKKGRVNGVDWILDEDGTVLAQEFYDNSTDNYRLRTQVSGKWEVIEDRKAPIRPNGPIGIMPDKSGLVIVKSKSNGFDSLMRLDFEGNRSDELLGRNDAEIASILVDTNRVVHGVVYGGLQPSFEFFDPELTKLIEGVQAKVPNVSLRITSWSDGFEKIVLMLEGTGFAEEYLLLDRATGSLQSISSSRPSIKGDAIAQVVPFEYEARDGLTIPAVVTLPPGKPLGNLPAIIMPHGGPEAYDEVGFNWMAQFFANRGYLVVQPNFRGSSGFGRDFTQAGYGGWGGSMQDDITDGVKKFIADGYIDPNRVCIVGWSYGGYAALAGGAFTPELYQCVVAIAPVSDLPRMLIDEKRDHGKDHWVVSYWEKAMGNGEATRETLKEKSPANFAEQFAAPVLLIHGKDDFVVKDRQSKIMESALKKAGKEVEFVQMRGEDHSLSTPGARLEALKAMDTFVQKHIGE